MLNAAEELLRIEFNEWAHAGRGESMEQGHLPIGEQAIATMGITPKSRVLDLGCGSGWASRLIAGEYGAEFITGIDVSDDMIRVAQRASTGFPRIDYQVASAADLPFPAGQFTHVFSMESIYYYPEPAAALKEVYRVLEPNGLICVVVDLFKENEPTGYWVQKLKVPVHFLGESEYRTLFESAGFRNVETQHLKDPSPVTPELQSDWFRSGSDYLQYREIGSLMITGSAKHV
jgi:ubiquinone/menaquinone biosynthesis C-methylase UbiE